MNTQQTTNEVRPPLFPRAQGGYPVAIEGRARALKSPGDNEKNKSVPLSVLKNGFAPDQGALGSASMSAGWSLERIPPGEDVTAVARNDRWMAGFYIAYESACDVLGSSPTHTCF